jgi:hypothetical protein
VLIEVHDEAVGAPNVRDVDPKTAETGRGLHLVQRLTGGQWGWHLKKARHRKCVWAVVTMPAPSQTSHLTARRTRRP